MVHTDLLLAVGIIIACVIIDVALAIIHPVYFAIAALFYVGASMVVCWLACTQDVLDKI